MNKILNRGILLCTLIACVSAYGYSNPIEGGSSEAVTNHYQVSVPWYMVGSNTEGNSLTITNGGQVDNWIGYIGNAIASSNNSAFVTGSGSAWNSSMELSVGVVGAGNELFIMNGGQVSTTIGYLGNNSDNNAVSVDGAGSFFNSATLYVGHIGSSNFLDTVAGGRVESASGYIGYWISADGNLAQVQGTNSVWNNSGILNVGDYGSGNGLSITTGGRVDSSAIHLGVQAISSNNLISVAGNGSILNVSQLYVGGSSSGAGGVSNRVEVQNGGVVTATDLSIYSGNQFDLNTGGRLAINANFNTAMAGFNFNAGATLEVGGELTGMAPSIEDQRTVILNGPNAVWNVGVNDLDLGSSTSENALMLKNGASVMAGRSMNNRNYSMVFIDPESQLVIASNYYQDATSVLYFGVETNVAGVPLNALVNVGGVAEFEAGATLQYHSNVGVLDFDTFYTNLILQADQLIVAGVTNANAVDLQALQLDGSLVDLLLWEQNQDIYGLVGRKYLAESAGFLPDSMMAQLAKEIDDFSLLGNTNAVVQINKLNRLSPTQQNAQLTQRYAQGSPTYRHRQGMLGGQKKVLAQSRSFQSSARSSGVTPEGVSGPQAVNQGLGGWIRGYGSWANHDGGSFSGFDQSIYGMVVGLDKDFGGLLLGLAGGYARSGLDQDNNDRSDANTSYGIVYGSIGSADWFGDVNVSYGRSHIKARYGSSLGGAYSTDADNYAVYIGGGKEIQLSGGGFLLAPEAAMQVGYFDQDSYRDGFLDVGAYDRWSYQSRIGTTLALQKLAGSVRLKPEVRIYWLHEFNSDPDQIGYSLIGGSTHYAFGVQGPDEDVFEMGAGLSAKLSERLEFVLDVDGQLSDRYESIAVGVRTSFEF